MDTKEALKRWNAEKAHYEERVKRRTLLETRHRELSAQVTNLRTALDGHAAAKDAAVSSFAVGDMSHADLAKHRDTHDAAAKALSHAEEVLAAVNREMQSNNTDQKSLQQAEREVWHAVFKDLSKEASALAGPVMLKAQAALALTGKGFIWSDTLVDIFGREKQFKDLKELAEQMKSELFR